MARVLGIFWILTLSIPAAWASETYGSSSEDWSFTLMPYIWGTSLKGTAAPLPPLPAAEIDASFGDIINEINLGFMGAAELRKGKFGIIADVLWLDISADSSGPVAPVLNLIELDATTLTATLLGAYRVLEQEQGWLDLVVGARGYYIDTSLDIGLGIILSSAHTEGWVDAMGGIRTLINLGKGFYATALAIGGGGGSSSAVDVIGKVGYTFTNHISAFAGYRYVKVDYQNKRFGWDVELQGPLIGGTYKF
jgi:hypothetical protein